MVQVTLSGTLLATLIDEGYSSINSNLRKSIGILFGNQRSTIKNIVSDNQIDKESIEININITEYLNHYDSKNLWTSRLSESPLILERNDFVGIVVFKSDNLIYPSFQEINLIKRMKLLNQASSKLVILIINLPSTDKINWLHGFSYTCFGVNPNTLYVIFISFQLNV